MNLHSHKFELMIHHASPPGLLNELPFSREHAVYNLPDGSELTESCQVRDLGIIVSPDGSWSTNINNLVTKAKGAAAWVLSVFRSRDVTVMMTLYTSLVRSHIEYCCPLWSPTNVGDIKRLEDVQKQFTAKILQIKDLNYHDRLRALNMMSLKRRREHYSI